MVGRWMRLAPLKFCSARRGRLACCRSFAVACWIAMPAFMDPMRRAAAGKSGECRDGFSPKGPPRKKVPRGNPAKALIAGAIFLP